MTPARFRRPAAATIFGAALLLAFAAPASAQLVSGSDAPIDIFGDRIEGVGQVVTLTGSARVVQGEGILSAERIVATLDEERNPKTIECQGGVRYSNSKEAVAGDTALYDDAARTITFTGNVVVTQGENVITGGVLVYWIDTGRFNLTPAAGMRIRGFFKQKPAASST
ncbi:MAG: hypothetical protein K2Q06_06565 [Parvularculaceae bacterium]|nr:hypothetical protein [Parvularculaceae bacterium]